jgi:hypothetical protein
MFCTTAPVPRSTALLSLMFAPAEPPRRQVRPWSSL